MSKPCASVKARVRLYALDITLVIPITIVFGVLEHSTMITIYIIAVSKAKMLVFGPRTQSTDSIDVKRAHHTFQI